MTVTPLATIGYLVSSLAFIFGIRQLQSPATARNGNRIAAAGMLLALLTTELLLGASNYGFIIPTMLVAAGIGAYVSRSVHMTAMPQMVAMFNGMGAGAAVAFAKLQELMTGRPITYQWQREGNAALLAAIVAIGIVIVIMGHGIALLVVFVLLALALGVLFVLPIGGADMPVIISLLNSFTGTAAAMTGFVLGNNALIVAGALVGASGTILTQIMSRAMNRSLGNVLFGAFGQVQEGAAAGADGGTVRTARG